MPNPWGNWGGGGSSGVPNTGFWNNFAADPANTPGDYIRYGMGPVDKANYANSGMVPGTIPNAADTTYNDRMASAYAFGQNWPSIAQPVQSMVNGLRDPNSGFNQAQMMPGVTVGSINPFQDPNSSLIDPAYQAMQQGVNAAGGGLYEGLDAWRQLLGSAASTMPDFSDVRGGGSSSAPGGMPGVTSGASSTALGAATNASGMPNFYDAYGVGSSSAPGAYWYSPSFMASLPANVQNAAQNDFSNVQSGASSTAPNITVNPPLPTGSINFNTLVPDPGGAASNTSTPPSGKIDFGPNSNVAAPYTPPAAVQPNQQFSAGNESNNFALDPALAAMYSNTSGAGTSALQLSEATSHPSYMNYLAWLAQNHPYSGSWLGQ